MDLDVADIDKNVEITRRNIYKAIDNLTLGRLKYSPNHLLTNVKKHPNE